MIRKDTSLNIALLANDSDNIDFEIYSRENDQEIVHCQGQAVWSCEAAPFKLDLEQIKRDRAAGQLDASSIYAEFTQKGLICGPAFRTITAIHRDNKELLAQLRLPRMVEGTSADYVL